MEKKFFTLLFIFVTLATTSKILAQDTGERSYIAEKDAATAYLKNSVITIDNQTFDYRILKHYTEADLRSLPASKLKQIHFLYTESFSVKNMDACPSVKITDIDIAKLERFRKENEPAIVEVGTTCKVQVELMSAAMLKQKMEEFKK
ncbi:MAG TPA: hypothetical protein PLS10_10785 [Chitinophagales bacterium]|jgi:hypothetical protein|nr:hypothetical protein [Chitinophagales bacterium]